jgi:hypothetical protein
MFTQRANRRRVYIFTMEETAGAVVQDPRPSDGHHVQS